jgi:Uma2 family endonuclease
MSTMSMQPHLTFDDFLAMERESELKHELIGGLAYNMAGVSSRHDDIVVNLVLAIGAAARASGCRARAADQLVKVDDINAKYPDFGVYCEDEAHDFYVTKPCLLAEVLSPTSHERDKVAKLAAYRRLPTLNAYLIVDPETQTVMAHMRDRRGKWATNNCGLDDQLLLPCPEMMLQINDIFA